jgi:hypothetical protein
MSQQEAVVVAALLHLQPIEGLREQLDGALVTDDCGCGCGSLEFHHGPSAQPLLAPWTIGERTAIDAYGRDAKGRRVHIDIIVDNVGFAWLLCIDSADLEEGGLPARESLVSAGDGPSHNRTYTLLGPDGRPYRSATPGTLGGNRRGKLYGRLDCPSAFRAIAAGGYVNHRVFFANESTAIAAGYRPCAGCMPQQYAAWKSAQGELPSPAKSGEGQGVRAARGERSNPNEAAHA